MRLLLSLVLLFFLPGTAVACWQVLTVVLQSSIVWPLAVGALLGVLLEQFVLRRFPAIGVFEHEFTHALAALLWLRPVTSFIVRRHGGSMRYRGGFGGQIGDAFIGLAPYVLPTFTAALVLARPWVPREWFPWFAVAVGLTFGYHLWSTIGETRNAWHRHSFRGAGTGEWAVSDVARRGFVYSALFIATVTLAIHGLLLAVLWHGYAGVPVWGSMVWRVSVAGWATAFAYGKSVVRGIVAVGR